MTLSGSQITERRLLNRRQLLQRSAVLGLTVPALSGLLAACGGDDDDAATESPTATAAAESPTATAAAVSEPTATTAATGAESTPTSAVDDDDDDDDATEVPAEPTTAPDTGDERRGGSFSSYETTGPVGLDPYVSSGQPQSLWSAYTYSLLFKLATGPGVPPGSLEAVPDVAASVEVAADGLTYTVTLRDDVRWHPPIDRLMTAEDVVFTWDRGVSTASPRLTGRGIGAVVESIEATDDRTVVWQLSEPYPFFLQMLADPKAFFIMPQETDTEFNPAEQAIGSGPWVLEDFRPDTAGIFRRFDQWHHGPEMPYYDEVVVNIIPEYATQLTQFLGGNLDWIIVQPSDLRRVLDAIPDVQIYERPPYPLSVLNFSPRDERWDDVRLRRAVSMAIDRDALLDAAYGLRELEAEGIAVQRNWHNHIPVAFTEYWLDPKGDEIDPEVASYFRYDPEAARALVDEAGGPFETSFHYASAGSRYGEPYRIISELMIQYWRAVGINVQAVEEDYNTEFLGSAGTAGGNFDGLMWIAQTRTDPFQYLATQYMSPDHGIYGRWVDPELTQMLEEIQAIVDPDELTQRIRDVQNETGRRMYVVPMQFSAVVTYVAYQPWVENALDYQSFTQNAATEALPHYWENR